MSQSIPVEMPTHPRSARGFALWQMGFRPFYLLASSFAALSIPVWALKFSGWLAHPYLRGPLWHAHEMLFGFTLAVIVGFLFTAGRNGSNRPTPTGTPLALLVALWVAGRVLVLTPFGWAAAIAGSAGACAHFARWTLWQPWRTGDIACYLLVSSAAIVRVAVPPMAPQWTLHAVLCSAALWSAGFGLYAVRYWPVLTRDRVDGGPG